MKVKNTQQEIDNKTVVEQEIDVKTVVEQEIDNKTVVEQEIDGKTGVYVHFPFCKKKCKYCAFVSSGNLAVMEEYTSALIKEIDNRAIKGEVSTVYFGGGTPSVLPKTLLERVLNKIKSSFSLTSDCEITIECNPESVTQEFADFCVLNGINRVSIGLQTANDSLLKEIGRIHSLKQFLAAVEIIKNAGVKNISCDIMLGLPGQTINDVKETLETVTNLKIQHISIYSLKVESGTPLYLEGFSVNEDLQADMYEFCLNYLNDCGFERYEVSNFALNDSFLSRHNLKYWFRTNYYGFGLAAHSFLNGVRQENTSNMQKYLAGNFQENATTLTKKDEIEEEIMLPLRTKYGINLTRLASVVGVDLLKDKKQEIEFLLSKNLIKINGNRLTLSKNAYYVMNSIILKLMPD